MDCSLAEVGFGVLPQGFVALGMGVLAGPVAVVTGYLAAYVVPGSAHRSTRHVDDVHGGPARGSLGMSVLAAPGRVARP